LQDAGKILPRQSVYANDEDWFAGIIKYEKEFYLWRK
jgi:hypothetical protein